MNLENRARVEDPIDITAQKNRKWTVSVVEPRGIPGFDLHGVNGLQNIVEPFIFHFSKVFQVISTPRKGRKREKRKRNILSVQRRRDRNIHNSQRIVNIFAQDCIQPENIIRVHQEKRPDRLILRRDSPVHLGMSTKRPAHWCLQIASADDGGARSKGQGKTGVRR